MALLLFTVMVLWSSDAPRMVPVLPDARRWMETGNRHARRRDAKLGRQGW